MDFIKIFLSLLVLFLFGCDNASAPFQLELDENVASGTVARGGKVVVSLKGNPTTGYIWTVSQSGAPYMQFIKEEYDGTNPNLIGSGGISRFIFDANQQGNAVVEFKYSRSWEMSGEAKTAKFKVLIK